MSDYELATTLGLEANESESLLRLVWDPCDIDPNTGQIMTSAFEKSDLRDSQRGLSVDQKSIAVRAAMVCVAKNQYENAKGRKREAPMLAEVLTSKATSLAFKDDPRRALAAIQSPIPANDDCPANPAHVEIFNITDRNSKSAANELRILLQEIFSIPVPFDRLVPPDAGE
nr:hypothetical protein [Brucella intermedia]